MMLKSWTSTLRLPKSTFPPRPLPQLRGRYLRDCTDGLYKWQQDVRPADQTFLLHDGPPYANGDLHVGHALNKVLKDMILRVKVQQGRRVAYRPGWDCHGLPIELKAVGPSGGKNMRPVDVRHSARKLAADTVLRQMESFRSYGIMSDWDKRWTTMDASYEIKQLRLFQDMVRKGFIYRKYRPVYWSPSSGTALAEAELEYRDDHVSTAAYIRFPVVGDWSSVPELGDIKGKLYAAIWTTTPWTLPANRAIALHNDLDYSVVQLGEDSLLVASSRVDDVLRAVRGPNTSNPRIRPSTLKGRQLREAGLMYTNQLQGPTAPPQPIIHANFVSSESGTGLVHCAPGHGFEDYEICGTLGIPTLSPVDDEGYFTKEAYPTDPEKLMSGGSVLDDECTSNVLALMGQDVLGTHRHIHKYPYDWRTKQPVIVRATAQWFADVASVKDAALGALGDVHFIPEGGRRRLESFVRGRSEWCISRQRAWGVPIPALYDKCGNAVFTDESVEHIISVIEQRGSDAWWSDEADDRAWIAPSLNGEYRRGTDTMDVWFDSGSSWTQSDQRADVYLEGSDQHRGWFQSSLLTRIASSAARGSPDATAPFKRLITHGFTLDQTGKKMSKSLGNTISPEQVMDGTLLPPLKVKGKKVPNAGPTYNALGPDALRLWVAGSDYTRDVALGKPVLMAVSTALVKYRTIIKMLLGSMHPEARSAPLTGLDEIALSQLGSTMQEVGNAYDQHEFYRAFSVLNRWVNIDLSAFYLDALKDRLYCGDGGGILEPIFFGFMRMLAPIAPVLVEEAWDHCPAWLKEDASAIHPLRQLYSSPLIDPGRVTRSVDVTQRATPILMATRAAVMTALERARTDKVVGSSLQCSVVLETDDAQTLGVFEEYAQELESIFVVSSVAVSSKASNGAYETDVAWQYVEKFDCDWAHGEMCTVRVQPPKQAKCPRCWRYVAPADDVLCGRCAEAVGSRGEHA